VDECGLKHVSQTNMFGMRLEGLCQSCLVAGLSINDFVGNLESNFMWNM